MMGDSTLDSFLNLAGIRQHGRYKIRQEMVGSTLEVQVCMAL